MEANQHQEQQRCDSQSSPDNESSHLLPTSSSTTTTAKTSAGDSAKWTQGKFQGPSMWVWMILLATVIGVWLFEVAHHGMVASNSDKVSDTFVTDSMRFDFEDDDNSRHDSTRYTATQFISFTINTMGGSAVHGECDGRSVDPETNTCYLGDYDVEQDALHRLDILAGVLDRLKNDTFQENPRINPHSDVLKIFILPEFYLRGPHGAYSTAQLQDADDDDHAGLLIQVSKRLREIIVDEAFTDYLFVFGTTVFAQKLDDPVGMDWWENDVVDSTKVLYYNFAPIFKGGPGHSHFYIVMKNWMSVGDFLNRSKLPDPAHMKMYSHVEESKVLQDTLVRRGITLLDNNLIEMDGIRIGVEVCLDHLVGILWDRLQTHEHSTLVDVQLITSAGMAIEDGPTPLVPGGVAYMTDGEASSAACIRTDTGPFDPEKVCKVPPDGLKRIPLGGDGYSTFVSLESCIDENIPDELYGYFSIYQPQGCASTLWKYGIDITNNYEYFPPSIEIYPTINLPRLRSSTGASNKKKKNSTIRG